MELVELQIPRNAAYVGLARLILTSAARLAGLPAERLEDLKIAVSEAAAHAIRTARDGGPLLVAFGVHDGAFEVHLFDPVGGTGDTAEAMRGWPSEGGLGLQLVEGLVDEVRFPEATRSQLVLRFLMDEAVASAAEAPEGTRAH